jgi:hypothetical protein
MTCSICANCGTDAYFSGVVVMNETLSSMPANECACAHQELPSEPLLCARCQSERVETRSYGKKIGGAIGAAAGVTSGVALVLSGAEAGAVLGSLAGPVGLAAGGLAGSLIAVMMSGVAGCAAGAAFGNVVDENVLDKYRCVECGYTFSQSDI